MCPERPVEPRTQSPRAASPNDGTSQRMFINVDRRTHRHRRIRYPAVALEVETAYPPGSPPTGHPFGPNQVLVGHQACLGHGGHTTWTCRTCQRTVYGPPPKTHCPATSSFVSVFSGSARMLLGSMSLAKYARYLALLAPLALSGGQRGDDTSSPRCSRHRCPARCARPRWPWSGRPV